MSDNGTRRSLVSYQETAAAADRAGAKYNIDTCEELAGVFEEGMLHVLRQIAKTQLLYEHEHEGVGYEKSNAQLNKVNELIEGIKVDIQDEQIKKRLFDLQSEVGNLELYANDAGYIAGFLAGYRFLKELNPKS